MSKGKNWLLGAALLLAGTAVAFAEGESTTGAEASAPAATTAAPKVASASHHSHKAAAPQVEYGKIAGTVESVDPSMRKVELKSNDGSMKSFMLESNAKIMKNGKVASLNEVAKGDRVKSLRYNKTTNQAHHIEIGS